MSRLVITRLASQTTITRLATLTHVHRDSVNIVVSRQVMGVRGPTGPTGPVSTVPGPTGPTGGQITVYESSTEPPTPVPGDQWVVRTPL